MTSVRVYLRMRPFNKREKELGNLDIPFKLKGKEVIIPDRQKQFSFDESFGPEATQDQVFKVVGRKVVGDFMEGFNATQFVYGQTGSGKTWTMMGTEEQRGVIPRSAAMLFEEIEKKPTGWSFEIDASYLEIYMERINDLLDPDKVNLDLKEDKYHGVFVAGVTKEAIASLEDVYEILRRGDKVRKVASTKMNAGSSRSHSVLSIFLSSTSPEKQKTMSQLNLVDLAGSERIEKTGATGETLKQGTLINLSLTTLSQVISGLAKAAGSADPKKAGPIPYRNSKLTRLLQTSLGGNAKTGLSIHISPHIDNLDESISTCEFGKRAKMIKTNAKAVVQKTAEQLELELEALQKAYDRLKKEFLALSGGKLPEGLVDAIAAVGDAGGDAGDAGDAGVDGGDAGGEAVAVGAGGGGGGGGGASYADLEKEKEKVTELSSEKETLKRENDHLISEIASLEEELHNERSRAAGLKKDFDIKQLEVQTLETKLRNLMDSDNGPVEEVGDSADKNLKKIAELTKLLNQQRDMLNREREENRDLKQENVELVDELTEKTRRLALAELQVMRYENARSKVKDGKIKVRVVPRKARPSSSAWKAVAGLDETPRAGEVTSRTSKADFEEMRKNTILEKFGNLNPVPLDELECGREGFLYERIYKKTDFIKRWFVLQDGFLYCYDQPNTPVCDPRYCVPLSDSKVGSCPKHGDKEFCFMVLCGQYFNVLASATDSEKVVWLKDMQTAKYITHENLMSLAYFNSRAVETIPDPEEQSKMSGIVRGAPYARMGESDYALNTPLIGGKEGFLYTTGFALTNNLTKEWLPWYVLVKDSCLLAFDLQNHSELVTEPRGVMVLGTEVEAIKQHEEDDADDDDNDDNAAASKGDKRDKSVKYYFTVVNNENPNNGITFFTTSAQDRDQWVNAVNIGCLVSAKHVMLATLHREKISIKANIATQEFDLLGRPMPPAVAQAYDEQGMPLNRHPDGRIVDSAFQPVLLNTPFFNKDKRPLDPFHRLLPDGAKAMFAANPPEPVGVGINGKHYAYPSGRELSASDAHFGVDGKPLAKEAVLAANGIVPALKIASIVQSALLTASRAKVFDAFGRVLRRTREGQYVNVDGHQLPATATVFDVLGNPMQHRPSHGRGTKRTLEVQHISNTNEIVVLGKVTVEDGYTSLLHLHSEVKKALDARQAEARNANPDAPTIGSLVFLDNSSQPITDKEREFRIASDFSKVLLSCRDSHGKRMAFVPTAPFAIEVNHLELDAVIAKEKEDEFLKFVGINKRRRTTVFNAVTN